MQPRKETMYTKKGNTQPPAHPRQGLPGPSRDCNSAPPCATVPQLSLSAQPQSSPVHPGTWPKSFQVLPCTATGPTTLRVSQPAPTLIKPPTRPLIVHLTAAPENSLRPSSLQPGMPLTIQPAHPPTIKCLTAHAPGNRPREVLRHAPLQLPLPDAGAVLKVDVLQLVVDDDVLCGLEHEGLEALGRHLRPKAGTGLLRGCLPSRCRKGPPEAPARTPACQPQLAGHSSQGRLQPSAAQCSPTHLHKQHVLLHNLIGAL
jgi:hypothetical protein